MNLHLWNNQVISTREKHKAPRVPQKADDAAVHQLSVTAQSDILLQFFSYFHLLQLSVQTNTFSTSFSNLSGKCSYNNTDTVPTPRLQLYVHAPFCFQLLQFDIFCRKFICLQQKNCCTSLRHYFHIKCTKIKTPHI